ncbi:restriction endonuclease subunit S [Lactococcus lactis]|uniref:Type I restriction-modification system specificity subunit S n=1 Tax=Lactococcus lactis subsp. lactis TaxID=1360 RepID=A0A0V8CZ16_LACLL|nr:restriction endonuclease subunit S [Lactococcus lactis]KSU06574.1 Type I restriction-modification system specificity subunit S [Lactococcus lactis subsp. lactis]
MKERLKAPELRFPGFTDDWEERKLGDITKISTGKLDANAMVENGKYDFYTSGIKKYRIDVAAFEGPSITIAGNGATVGYMHLADNKFNAYQRTYVLQEFLVDRSFIFSEIGNKLPKKIKQEARTGNIPYIVMDMLTELKLSIPQNNSEQQKIGSFFKQLDDTIDLHQRKLDLLKEQKKGYLQKMFPKNGEKVPELRFEGFTDAWEQRKLGESCRIGDIDHRMPKSVTEGVPYLMTGDFIGENKLNFENTKLVSIEDYDQLSKKIKPEYGDILFARYASVGAVRYVDIQRKFLISYSCAIMKPNIDIKGLFLYQLLQTDFMKRKIEFEINPNSQKNIGIDSLKKLKISIPIIEEQEKIGKFFKDLDNTIALHQLKLDLLKEQKKGFLQKMFA